jgi:hypothetical protein
LTKTFTRRTFTLMVGGSVAAAAFTADGGPVCAWPAIAQRVSAQQTAA